MSLIYQQVWRELEQERLRAEKALAERLAFLYDKLPEIKAIDDEMAEIGLQIAKSVLRPSSILHASNSIADLQRRSDELSRRRTELLYDNGYDETFFDDVYNCAECKDTGRAGGGQERCRCVKQRIVGKYYKMSNLDKVLERENFDAFNLNYYSDVADIAHGISPRDNMSRIYSIATRFVDDFDKKFENLLMYGGTGLGKTFLSNCIAKDLLDAGKTVLYTTAGQLFKMVENQRFGRGKDEMSETDSAFLALVTEVDLLIIDDLGTEFATVVTTSELFSYINTRLLNEKSTIISTNLEPADFEEQYSDRLTSRLFGQYYQLRFFGDDIRIGKKYGVL